MSQTATLPIRTKEAAALIGITLNDLYALVRAGRVPHWRVGRAVRFDRDRLLAWRDAGGTAQSAA